MDTVDYWKAIAKGRLSMLDHQHTKAVEQQDKIDRLDECVRLKDVRIDDLIAKRQERAASAIDWYVQYTKVCDELAAVQKDRRKIKLERNESQDECRRLKAAYKCNAELLDENIRLKEVLTKRTNAMLAVDQSVRESHRRIKDALDGTVSGK